MTGFCFFGFIGIIGRTPDKRISQGLFCPLVFLWFWFFIDIIGETPDKRITEGVFCRLSLKFSFIFWPIKTEFVLHFWSYWT